MTGARDDDEVEHLRELVGPSETSYQQLRRDRDEAQRVARDALAEVGELRGRITEMSVQLSRARQDQDLLQRRVEMSAAERLLDRASQRWTTSIAPRARRLFGR